MTSGFIRGAAKALAKNGKNAAKAVVKNGSNGNGNGVLKNGAEALTEGNLAKQAFVDKHKIKLKAPRSTQVVDQEEYLLNPNDLAIESARTEVRRKFTGLTQRSLPITDRIIDLDEVDTLVKDRYRDKLRIYLKETGSLKGHRKNLDKVVIAGQELRGKINVSKGKRDVKLKNTLKDAEEKATRDFAEEAQTVDPNNKFTGGHHRFELNLGAAITDGIEQTQLKPFWKLVQNSYPNLFPGNHPYNLVAFEQGFTAKLHQEVHRRLKAAGLDAVKVKKLLKGKTAGEKFAFIEKVSKTLQEIDDFMAKEMRKNRQQGVFK